MHGTREAPKSHYLEVEKQKYQIAYVEADHIPFN